MKNTYAHSFQFWTEDCTVLPHVFAHSSPRVNDKPQVLSKSEKHLPTSRALYAAGQQLQLKGDTSEAAKVVICLDTESILNCSPD